MLESEGRIVLYKSDHSIRQNNSSERRCSRKKNQKKKRKKIAKLYSVKSSPWCNRQGWLGVKHQLPTCLSVITQVQCRFTTVPSIHTTVATVFNPSEDGWPARNKTFRAQLPCFLPSSCWMPHCGHGVRPLWGYLARKKIKPFLPVCLLIATMWLRCFTLAVFMVFTLSDDS